MAENEVYFRQLNENVEEGFKTLVQLASEIGQEELIRENDTPLHFYCECSDENCRERIKVKPSEYRKIHDDRNRFIVVAEHDVAKVEKVVRKNDRYWVVQKILDLPESVPSLNYTGLQNT